MPRSRSAPRALDPSTLGDHLDRLFRAAWALCGSREDAEDLVQETYARLLARPRLLRKEDDLGYLLRALRNTFLNQRRTESRRLRPGPLPDQLDELVADPQARQPQAALEARELYAAVAALPADFRDVLVAVDITGLSYKEAAWALRTREGTVMSRLYPASRSCAESKAAQPDSRRKRSVSAFGVNRSDENLLARRALIAVGLFARDGQ